MIDFEISKAILDDAEGIFALDSIENDAYSLSQIRHSLCEDGELFIVAKVASEIIGFADFSVVLDEAELIKIVVSYKYRRMGVGKKLITYAMQTLKNSGVCKVFLEVREDNLPAIDMYNKCGFIKYGNREKYYGDTSALLYRLDIND